MSVHQQCVFDERTVERGSISCVWDIPYELPYNIEEEDLASWSVECSVYGHYIPLDSVVELVQTVNGVEITIGYLRIEWSCPNPVGTFPWPVPNGPGCSPDVWIGTFHMMTEGDAILPHSSYYPDIISGCGIIAGDKIGLLPDPKYVDIKVNTTWEGCTEFNVLCTSEDHIVQKGYINCTWTVPDEIPYNIEAEDLAEWTAYCEVMGQYEILGDSDVVLYQTVNNVYHYLGQAYVDWTHEVDPVGVCAPDIWTGIFIPWWCNNPILPWSSYYPEVPANCEIEGGLEGLLTDPKYVDIVVTTTWEGCETFDVILTHKIYS